MKIVIDCDKLMKRENQRKVVYRKKGAKREKARKKEKQGYENFT